MIVSLFERNAFIILFLFHFRFIFFPSIFLQALESISKALRLCCSSGALSNGGNSGTSLTSIKLIDLQGRCAQIYTLRGDIQKDMLQWSDAIEVKPQIVISSTFCTSNSFKEKINFSFQLKFFSF